MEKFDGNTAGNDPIHCHYVKVHKFRQALFHPCISLVQNPMDKDICWKVAPLAVYIQCCKWTEVHYQVHERWKGDIFRVCI